MGLFKDVVEGFAGGVALAMAERSAFSAAPVNHGSHMVRACCAQLGWSIHEQVGDTEFVLRFQDALLGTRPLRIIVSDAGHLVLFAVFSAAKFSPHLLSSELLAYLLRRNCEMSFPAWQVSTAEGLKLGLTYSLPVGGLNPPFFRFLCSEMCQEVADFDSKLHQAGVI